ncbi:TPA: hypothetical protein ACPZHQ_002239 [Yersinia enterocolitica]
MLDIANAAQMYTDIQLSHALANTHTSRKTPSIRTCQYCDAPNSAVQQVLGGVTTSATRQEMLEFTQNTVLVSKIRC